MKTKILGLVVMAGLLALVLIFSSNKPPMDKDYEKYWKKVDSLTRLGLPKSALEIVDKIYNIATDEKNTPQFIKANIYKIKLMADYQEDFMENAIADIKNEIKASGAPQKQILHSVLAELYWRYYQANRYKILERTDVINYEQEDIRTWGHKKLIEAVTQNYLASLEDAAELKKIKLSSYDVILEKGENSKKFRPTLFDFLAHRAIDFFMNDESRFTSPADRFTLNSPVYFDSPEDFSKLNITHTGKESGMFYAMKIFQELITFHLKDTEPRALIDIDLKRLKFVYNNTVLPEKDSLYPKSLKKLETQFINSPYSTDATFELASYFRRQGGLYKPLVSDAHKWDIKKAFEYCEKAINNFPGSDGANNCKILTEEIQKPSLDLDIESVNPKGKPFLGLLKWKNTQKVYFRIINVDYDTYREQSRKLPKKDLIKELSKKKYIEAWEIDLPDDGDYQDHSAEVAVPELPYGFYVILSGNKENFSGKNMFLAHTNFWISQISFISQKTKNDAYGFYVLDRITGTPLQNVMIKSYIKEYNYQTRTYEKLPWKNFESDKKGFFEIRQPDNEKISRSFILEFILKNDRLIADSRYYLGSRRIKPEKDIEKTYFFTDRAIYRPGQTVYFKGIILEKNGDDYRIKPGHTTDISLYDVNNKVVSELKLTSNDYGSVNGAFIIPTGLLNGMMRIKNKSGSVSFSVEDYKRPDFEVVFNPVKGSYKLNELVTVDGKATAYAGNPIDDAKVKYRVVRSARFPYRWYYTGGFFPSSPEVEITSGETNTDKDGNFIVSFKAIPDHLLDKKYNPVFNYRIYADVTDISGETQSAENLVSVSYVALLLDTGIPEKVNREASDEFKILSTNLNGEPINVKSKITINKLKQPEKLFRKRLWQEPDKFVINKEDFSKDFPNSIFSDENEPEHWPVESLVFEREFNTAEDSVFTIENLKNLKQGKYVVEISATDEFGNPVKNKKYFTVFSPNLKKTPVYEYNWFTILNDKGEPGEDASFLIGTMAGNVHAIYEIQLKGEIIHREWIKLDTEQRKITIPIKEEYRGNFSVVLVFVKDNRFYKDSFVVKVPYTDKELDISFETFRDKVEPGAKEEWKILIKGKNGDRVAAEMLASMYDESLDAFASNEWVFELYKSYNQIVQWSNRNNFSISRGQFFSNIKWAGLKFRSPVYDQLNWFGFNYYSGYFRNRLMFEGAAVPEAGMKMGARAEMDNVKTAGVEEPLDEVRLETEESAQAEKERFTGLQVRRDLKETAFFYPDLQTNDRGEVIIKFTLPESLTRWKMMGLAYTKDLKYGQIEKEITSQKKLMVFPNNPRFFRQGDTLFFTAKIVNLSDEKLSGTVSLDFLNTLTNQEVNESLGLIDRNSNFEIEKGESIAVSWKISIPENLEVITSRVVAVAGNFSDGEENAIPVLPSRIMVTESFPMPINGKGTKKFTFKQLLKSGSEKSLKNYHLTLEFTSNPAWYAVQALPYLSEPRFDNSDAVFGQFYANSIAFYLANSDPKIKRVFESWQNRSPDALLSNLEKNRELKNILLEQTPWVLEAKDESERKRRIALLFDLNTMSNRLDASIRKLNKLQSPNGGFPWFEGMRDSRFITQRIVTGFGKLDHLGVLDAIGDNRIKKMMQRAVRYLDNRIDEDYKNIKKYFPDKMEEDHLSPVQIQYLYSRSFYKDIMINPKNEVAFNYFRDQANKYWLKNNKYLQGMIALALHRYGDDETALKILRSLKEKSLENSEMGIYWRQDAGYFWYQAPVETQAMMIEAFDEVGGETNREFVEKLKIWLLKQKQTQNWKSDRATIEAVYALLSRGNNLLKHDEVVEIEIGNEIIDEAKMGKVEAGTGYFQTSWKKNEITPEMGNISVTKNDDGIAWGALYWQYFEDMDKIKAYSTPLSIIKKLFLIENTPSGPVLTPVENNGSLKIGDKIKVRIELRVDRNMEYIHMQDMRASSFEPVNVLSGYRYQGGLGYYESTRDASTNFFFDYLPKGTYVFEYPLIVSQKGDFSNGITTIQCMYAPEFSSHSEGIRVKVE